MVVFPWGKMATPEQNQGQPKRPEAHEAFEAILKDLAMIGTLNYRHTNFRKWKQVVETALVMYRGEGHPDTVSFKAIEFSGPFPRSPLDPPVTEKDKLMYSFGLEKTKGILEETLAEFRAIKGAEAPTPSAGFQIRPMDSLGRVLTPVTGPEPIRNEAPPPGGIRIVARAGTNVPVSLDDYLRCTDDPMEQGLVLRLKEVLEKPGSSWEGVRDILAELWWHKRESVQKLLPIILKR